MRRKFHVFWLAANLVLTLNAAAQKNNLPSKIGDGFVLEFAAPFERIVIDTDEKNLPNRELAEIVVNAQTKIFNHKGKPLAPDQIRPGAEVEIKLDQTSVIQLVAAQIKLRSNLEKRDEEVDGYLDRVEDGRAVIDGRTVELAPNAFLIGEGAWKGKTFSSFKDIPLGSLVDLKGSRQANGLIFIKQGTAKPNVFTPLEVELVKAVQQGLTVPPPDKLGAGVKIGQQTFKVVEDLEVNTYVNKVGMRVVPKFLRNLPPEDPNKVLFRFYVLENDSPNAAAFSDGSVFIHTGLLKRLENEAQLAIVLGHEIAHVTNEHLRRRQETAAKQAILAGIIGATAGAVAGQNTGMLIAQLGYGLMSNKFSRELEDQADRVGLYYAFDAGYDVRESSKLWRRLMGNYNETALGVFLYADHPAMLARLRNMRREVVLNYAAADFSESLIAREKFVEGVGVYFGWIAPKPKAPKSVIKKTIPKTIKPVKKKANVKTKNAKPGNP